MSRFALQPSMTFPRLASTSVRLLSSGPGRAIPHPGQGGVALTGTTSPSPHHSLPPSTIVHDSVELAERQPVMDAAISDSHSHPSPRTPTTHSTSSTYPRGFTPKGKPIPTRPARTTRVTLPSGYLEPTSYPPSTEYFTNLENEKKSVHPLWQFFHVPPKAMEMPTEGAWGEPMNLGSLEVAGEGAGEAQSSSGRSWSAAELRPMSFNDLHTLWYVLLRERNVLATQREERRRASVHPQEGGDVLTSRAFKCRKSMARIKYVLNERRLALLAAAAPLDTRAPPNLPFSSTGKSDPALGLAALRGQEPSIEAMEKLFMERMEGDGNGNEDGVAVVEDDQVGKEEVESRDEGFGGGQEAREFVRDVKVEDGHVEKK